MPIACFIPSSPLFFEVRGLKLFRNLDFSEALELFGSTDGYFDYIFCKEHLVNHAA
jgi:hypothetical protein